MKCGWLWFVSVFGTQLCYVGTPSYQLDEPEKAFSGYNQVLNQNSEYEFMRVIKLKLHFSLPYNMTEFMYLTVLSV